MLKKPKSTTGGFGFFIVLKKVLVAGLKLEGVLLLRAKSES